MIDQELTAVIPQKPLRKRVHIAVRILLQFVSLLLCLTLVVSLLAFVLVADLRQVTTKEGFRALFDGLFSGYSQELPSPVKPAPAPKMARLAGGLCLEDPVPPAELPEMGELPSVDMSGLDFTNPDSLVDWIHGEVEKVLGEEADISKDTIRSFIQDSTVGDFLAEKASDALSALVSGGDIGQLLSSQDVMDLLKENAKLIEKTFQVELTQEVLDDLGQQLEAAIEQADVNSIFQRSIQDMLESEDPIVPGVDNSQLLEAFSQIVNGQLMWILLGICLVLALLLAAANFYNLPAALGWAGVPCILVGGIMSALMAVLILPDDLAHLQPMVDGYKPLFAPLHYGLLIAGAVMLVASIVWRIVRNAIEKKNMA